MTILLNIAHTADTPGKQSPDGKFKETEYSAKVVEAVSKELESYGFKTAIIRQKTYYGTDKGLKQVVDDANAYCRKDDCIFVSIHVDAAGHGKEWMTATGWTCYTTKGKTESDNVAEDLYWAAEQVLGKKGKKLRMDKSDGDKDKEENFYVLKNTKCPAVLTENFFQDCKSDVAYLTSREGFADIVKVHVDGILAYLQKRK